LEYARNIELQKVFHYYSNNSSCLRKAVWEKHPFEDVAFGEDQIWARTIVEEGYWKAYAENAVVYHSHNFALHERFLRCYIESRMFHVHFGYRLCPTVIDLLFQAWATTRRDLALAREQGWLSSHTGEVLLRPLDNLSRQCGYYAGSRNAWVFKTIRGLLSVLRR
jgi:rhamnosyltransferase